MARSNRTETVSPETFREKMQKLFQEAIDAGKSFQEITTQINNVEVEFGKNGGWKEGWRKISNTGE